MTDFIRLSHTTASTKVLGPGNRYAIWMQGCQKNCRRCINPAGKKVDGGFLIPIAMLLENIKEQSDIQGVTISGGEPFLQFEALEKLVSKIKSGLGYDIMLYSGYRLPELISWLGEKQAESFFSKIDIFIDGEYIDERDHGELYRGSDNQNIYFFTDKYAAFQERIYHAKNRDVEFAIERDGQIVLIGIPPKGFYEEFLERIGRMTE